MINLVPPAGDRLFPGRFRWPCKLQLLPQILLLQLNAINAAQAQEPRQNAQIGHYFQLRMFQIKNDTYYTKTQNYFRQNETKKVTNSKNNIQTRQICKLDGYKYDTPDK